MRYYGQNKLDELLIKRYFRNKKDGFFVECGAADGISENTCFTLERCLKWKGINIEPVDRLYSQLVQNRPHCRNLNYALSNSHRTSQFTDCIKENSSIVYGIGSLTYHDKVEHDDTFKYITFDVECVKFSEVFIENIQIDLFVLDVEGHELEAIDGILEIDRKYYPKIFCIEVDKIDADKLNRTLEPFYTIDFKTKNDIIYKRRY